jgi:hypothetical protein
MYIPRRPLGTRHQNRLVARARNEYCRVIHIDVPEATMPDRVDWLDHPALN